MKHLEEFCTDRQQEILTVFENSTSQQDCANKLNISRSTVKAAIKAVKKKAALAGVAPSETLDKLINCYMIGDHHLGMYAWSKETGDANYDTDIGVSLLEDAVDSLVARSPNSRHGLLCNLGDFFSQQ